MFKKKTVRMEKSSSVVHHGAKKESSYYMEMDPSGRYGRFREILGKGAMKTVYKAFDEILGMEVAWNQVILNDVFQSPEELERLYSEVHLLNTLHHPSIMKFYTSWINADRRTFNFITEMFTSGTLREYRQKYERVDIRAVKTWARQILEGLAYLHGHDPPVIHRDLKCDNVFVNGHLGQVKIGDLGLAATLRDSQHAHSVIGTPEFMAPELYEEEYDELVDIYSFGMCVLEMLTCDYPYSECSNPAQIYKKVTSGKLPAAFYRIQDDEAREFVGKCLENASKRPSASELLMDPFLSLGEHEHPLLVTPIKTPTSIRTPKSTSHIEAIPPVEMPPLLANPTRNTDMMITGTMNPEDDTIFLKVQISDQDGKARNIYFPFDTVSDTAIDVAMEMVKELDITDWDPFDIAEMIDNEISALVPTWKDDCDSPNQNLQDQQHSFKYDDCDDVDDDDDDENRTHHPFFSLSSRSSSQASLSRSPGFYTSCSTQVRHGNNAITWSQDDNLNNDDASSLSSLNSPKYYSNIDYCSLSNDDDYDDVDQHLSFKQAETTTLHDQMEKRNKCTRFCPEDTHRACNRNHQLKIARMRSFMDIRSQLLHKSLVEEINKRRLFNTVGAVENIGYHAPYW